jgi:SNF2 family DNA or RNA helicase
MVMYNIKTHSDIGAILADPGTCKTAPYLWAIEKRVQRGEVKKALIVTLNYLKRNVLEEMEKQAPGLRGVVLNGRAHADKVLNKKFKKAEKNIDYDAYIANYETMFSLVELFPDNYFQMIVLDEAHRIGNSMTRQTKTIVHKFEFTPYKYIVTGTLHANSASSFYMPFRFMGPDTVPHANFYEFRRVHFFEMPPESHIWHVAPGTIETVKTIIGNLSVLFVKRECLDLPPVIYQKRYAEMSPEQKQHYGTVVNDLYVKIDNICSKCSNKGKSCMETCKDIIMVKTMLVAISKLAQITAGFFINTKIEVAPEGKQTNKSTIIEFEKNPKLDLLMDTLLNIPDDRKIIIWCNFVHGIDMIRKRIATVYGEDSVIKVSKTDDAYAAVKTFEADPKLRFFVSNQAKSGAGLNIQFKGSNYQIFFSNNYSYIMRDQAEGRQDRQGQTEKVTVIDCMCENSIDIHVRNILFDKKELAEDLSSLARVIGLKKDVFGHGGREETPNQDPQGPGTVRAEALLLQDNESQPERDP